ncbi:MAG: hypothetical protein U0514_03880 [Candidatus Andersenbacteria bacterium]
MPTPTLILGIESSCDETAAALVDTRLHVHASVISSQIELHRVTHGVVPEVAARAHTERILPVIDECLRRAHATPRDIAAVAVTRGPGLITALMVGLETAKALAVGWNVPPSASTTSRATFSRRCSRVPSSRSTKTVAVLLS